MKIITTAILATLTLGTTQAAYTIKIPLEQDHGGGLPSGSINLKTAPEKWTLYEPEYSEWFDFGESYGCSNWSPDPTTIDNEHPFIQTATDCVQQKARYRQDQEQETTTKAIRNKGTAVIETQATTVSITRTATGTKQPPQCISNIGGIIFSAGQNYKNSPNTTNGDYAYYGSGFFTAKSLSWGLNDMITATTLVRSGYRYSAGKRLEPYSFNDSGLSIEGVYELCREKI